MKDAVNSTFNKETKPSEISHDNVKEILSEVLDKFGKFLVEKKDDIKDGFCETGHKYRDKVKNSPVAYVSGALAAGIVLGLLLRK
jgi:ElaB/YqjD/DUF883 family membrane-anchored ribosome-binding protein